MTRNASESQRAVSFYRRWSANCQLKGMGNCCCKLNGNGNMLLLLLIAVILKTNMNLDGGGEVGRGGGELGRGWGGGGDI